MAPPFRYTYPLKTPKNHRQEHLCRTKARVESNWTGLKLEREAVGVDAQAADSPVALLLILQAVQSLLAHAGE